MCDGDRAQLSRFRLSDHPRAYNNKESWQRNAKNKGYDVKRKLSLLRTCLSRMIPRFHARPPVTQTTVVNTSRHRLASVVQRCKSAGCIFYNIHTENHPLSLAAERTALTCLFTLLYQVTVSQATGKTFGSTCIQFLNSAQQNTHL